MAVWVRLPSELQFECDCTNINGDIIQWLSMRPLQGRHPSSNLGGPTTCMPCTELTVDVVVYDTIDGG